MPHAQKDHSVQVNGDQAASVFLQHLTSYPVVSDTIDRYTAHPYGRRSVDVGHSTYATLSAHLAPLLATPRAYLSPYLARADHLGDSTLQRIDDRFPAIKKPTRELYADGQRLVGAIPPLRAAATTTSYLVGTYRGQVDQVGRTNGPWAKWPVAAITTGIVVARDTAGCLQGWLGGAREQLRIKASGHGAAQVNGES